jgi:CheY-like chemotaxis protein
VIEDDELIRAMAASALRGSGRVVWEATDGGKALELCQQATMPVDLIITDVTAPGMSGEDLMGYFAVRYPHVPILHMSGFPKSQLISVHSVPRNAPFLSKPFTVQQLLEKVQTTLERQPHTSPE